MTTKPRLQVYRAFSPAVASLALGYLTACAQRPVRQSAPAPQTADETLALQGVTVVDVGEGRLLSDQTVVIAGSRIQRVGPATGVGLPRGARRIDASGKYLIPGLWDMHAHTEFPGMSAGVQDTLYRKNYPAYIASGVTGIREMAQRFSNGTAFFRDWQAKVVAGTQTGPRAVGPSADLTYELALKTPADAARVIDSLKAAGMAFIKFHDVVMPRKLFFAVAREARRAGLPLVGHVPRSVTNVEAADSGLRSVEHINEIFQCWPNHPAALDSVSVEELCRPVAAAYIRDSTWVVPTLVVADLVTNHDRAYLHGAQVLLRTLRRLGVKTILAGSDCAEEVLQSWGMEPACHRGFSILQELVLLVGAGLTPAEALQTATLNPAKFFGATDSLGTIDAGKLADLVLLDADPLADIRNVLKIRAVVANGHYFDRAALDNMDTVGVRINKGYADEIFAYGRIRRGRAGINFRAASDNDAEALGVPRKTGIVVESVRPNSAALAAGIEAGDFIIAVNGQSVASVQQFRRLTTTWKPGETITLETVRRGGVHRTVNVTLGE